MIKMSHHELKDLISQSVRECLQKYLKIEPPEDDRLLKIGEIVEYLGVSKVTIYNWKKQGKIPFHRMGRRIYFKKSEILKGFLTALATLIHCMLHTFIPVPI